jgi:hypothetical protein
MKHITDSQERNQEWLKNRPMWSVDKLDKALCKKPKRWLSYANSDNMAIRMGWLDMPSVIRSREIANSKLKRKKNIKKA